MSSGVYVREARLMARESLDWIRDFREGQFHVHCHKCGKGEPYLPPELFGREREVGPQGFGPHREVGCAHGGRDVIPSSEQIEAWAQHDVDGWVRIPAGIWPELIWVLQQAEEYEAQLMASGPEMAKNDG
jgi:hypothetical protein